MAVDPGSKRIGIAVSDPGASIAFPRDFIEASKTLARTAQTLARIALEEEVATVVVGLPLSMDGSRGPEADRASTLARALAEILRDSASVVEWDERLTSVAANRALSDAGVREHKRRVVVDGVAACLLLQSYLDFAAARR
jgi:putative Holliday junction resolvase